MLKIVHAHLIHIAMRVVSGQKGVAVVCRLLPSLASEA